jgi:hypothetical protein
VQRLPHVPQLFVSVCRFTHVPLQYEVPAPQHTPFEQVEPDGHTVEHEPQCVASVRMFDSQPSDWRLPLQSAKPLEHVPVQALPVQAEPITLFDEHASPQPPQFAVVVVAVSHPSLRSVPLQSAKPVAHEPVHVPPEHVVADIPAVEHDRPQPPQFASEVVVFTSQPSIWRSPLQFAKPVAHVPLHVPPVHAEATTLAPEHVRPHPPQFVTVDVVSNSHPSAELPLQSPHPELHA